MMRKFLLFAVMVMTVAVTCAFGAGIKPDIDLSKMNGVMAYSGLFNVMCNSPAYV